MAIPSSRPAFWQSAARSGSQGCRRDAAAPAEPARSVIDEAPWFSLIPHEPVKVPLEWFAPEWWELQASAANDYQKRSAMEVFAKIHRAFTQLPLGEIPAEEFTTLGITDGDLRATRRTAWKFKVNLRSLVRPGMDHPELTTALSAAAPRNRRVVAVAEALAVLRRHVDGKLAPSGVVLTQDEEGKRYLCLRWRKDIDPAWLRAPALYLDAAHIGSFEIAKAWPGFGTQIRSNSQGAPPASCTAG